MITFFSVLIASITSCQKIDSTDLIEENQKSLLSKATNIQESNNWENISSNGLNIYSRVITNAEIKRNIIEKGLVLVYLKDNRKNITLPFEEVTASGKNSWTYQVYEGKLIIHLENRISDKSESRNKEINYVILSDAQVKSLEVDGHSRDELLQLDYEEIKNLTQTLK
ncbi:MAG: hypothetical protein ACXWFZ_12910 [Nitrososphaeraceae archaeon]